MSQRKYLVKNKIFLPYNPKLKEISRDLRKNQTEAEKKIWNEYLSKLDLNIMKQKIIGYFIVDFYIAKLRLIIEIDGEVHNKLKERDKERSLFLQKYNLKIIRITNRSILNNPEKTYKKLDEVLNFLKKNHPLTPSLLKEGEVPREARD